MLANGTLEKFPRLKIVVPHCGSFLPYMKQRAGAMFQMLAAMNLMEPVDFAASVGKLFFDTAGDPMPEQFDMLLKITSLDKIIFGTDYPYVPAPVVLRKKKFSTTNLRDADLLIKFTSTTHEFFWAEIFSVQRLLTVLMTWTRPLDASSRCQRENFVGLKYLWCNDCLRLSQRRDASIGCLVTLSTHEFCWGVES